MTKKHLENGMAFKIAWLWDSGEGGSAFSFPLFEAVVGVLGDIKGPLCQGFMAPLRAGLRLRPLFLVSPPRHCWG